MTKNTGFQQAVYAAKYTEKGDIALDKDGNFCSISGNKQAILVLQGHPNPDASKYEVVGSFKEGDFIDTYPTMVYNTEACPLPLKLPEYTKEPIESRYFEVRPSTTVLANDAAKVNDGGTGALSFTPVCNRDWDDPNGVSTTPASWTEGGINQETLKVRRIGEYYWTLENFKAEYSPNGSLANYALKQSQLDNATIPLTVAESNQKNGVFAYGASPSNIYMEQVKTYPTRILPIGVNPNLWGKQKVKNIINDVMATNGNPFKMIASNDWLTIGIIQTTLNSNIYKNITVWRENSNDTPLRLIQTYLEDPNKYGGVVYDIESKETVTLSLSSSATPTNWFISIKTNGRTFDQLPKIKVEYGNSYTGWIDCIDGTEESGWTLPGKAEFLQLFGMVGEDLSYFNLRKNFFVKSVDEELPWINNYPSSNQCKDLIGCRFLPIGQKNNGITAGSPGNDGEIYNYGQKIQFLTKATSKNTASSSSPALWMTDIVNQGISTKVCWDVYGETTSGNNSSQYWQKNIRLCRSLTDQELGYRLWRDDANDKILVTTLNEAQPVNTVELEKGLLRGLAVRWLNKEKTKVQAPLSKFLAEIEKTKDGGEYDWHGFNK